MLPPTVIAVLRNFTGDVFFSNVAWFECAMKGLTNGFYQKQNQFYRDTNESEFFLIMKE